MELQLYIENLGAIDKAEITISPLTVLAGENGTGKSFVTKFLYSVLKVLNQDVYKKSIINTSDEILEILNELKDLLTQGLFSNLGMFFVRIQDRIKNSQNIFKEDLFSELNDLDSLLETYSGESDVITKKIRENSNQNTVTQYIKDTQTLNLLSRHVELLQFFSKFISYRDLVYFEILQTNITSELKSNFQIPTIEQLIRHGTDKIIFEIKDIILIAITKNSLTISQDYSNQGNALNINRLVFFESSVYWRLSPELLNQSNQPKYFYLSENIKDERLTGIPQHFLDLRELVFANFKHGERPQFIEECANELQQSLNGKFSSNGNDLAFETNQGQAISKNLVSFGMTNLGVLQAVLSKNIINKGSFVFIDEPESNLHPEWQAVLAKILVKLAENGLFVVITTHSSDMLKALDVYTTDKEQRTFASVNYFEKNGKLAIFDNEEVENIGKFALVRNKLLEPYASLTFAKQGGFFDD